MKSLQILNLITQRHQLQLLVFEYLPGHLGNALLMFLIRYGVDSKTTSFNICQGFFGLRALLSSSGKL